VNEGLFREDLYYRLAVVEITMPALRARPEDIPILAQRFYERLAGAGKALPAGFIAQLRARAWPGNVRELRNHVERAVALGLLEADDAPPPSAASPLPTGIESIVPLDRPLKDARDAWTSAFEVVYVRAMLERTGGNVTKAAERAGVSRRFLQRTIARLGPAHRRRRRRRRVASLCPSRARCCKRPCRSRSSPPATKDGTCACR
jgi:DNA-binding NtrC family response regulator